jgi:hypothetical protein
MPALRLAIERESHRLSTKTAKILEVLSGSQTLSGPMLYQRVMRDIRELQRMWAAHRAELAEVIHKVPKNAPESLPPLRSLDRNAAAIGHQLEALSTAPWPRHPEIGVRSIRVRGQRVLTAVLRQLESEEVLLVPLLERSTPSRSPAQLSLVSGEPVATEARKI